MRTSIDKFGRILIPKRLREQLGITSGEELMMERVDDGIMITRKDVKPSMGYEGNLLVHTGELTTDADTLLSDLRDERLKKLSGL